MAAAGFNGGKPVIAHVRAVITEFVRLALHVQLGGVQCSSDVSNIMNVPVADDRFCKSDVGEVGGHVEVKDEVEIRFTAELYNISTYFHHFSYLLKFISRH